MSHHLDDIRARYIAWYNTDATYDGTGEAEWPDNLKHVESYELEWRASRRQRAMAHEIVREDIPWLLAEVERLNARLADSWDEGYSESHECCGMCPSNACPWDDGKTGPANPYREEV